ncbi:DUF455 family protein [Halobacteriovorax sp.]|uniref:DUF455 family protein n=1 Tax=Halobacteriovorax sp. TaxID=2020862 RepID=UPI00356461B2
MNIDEYARTLLFSPRLEDKLLSPKVIKSFNGFNIVERPKFPGRDKLIAFSDVQVKFPRPRSLHVPERRAMALHFFANHELLAIEMMAAAILCLPTRDENDMKAKRGLLSTIADEQKHFLLYKNRMENLGLEFGGVALNDFFWKKFSEVKELDGFFALVSLTFEAANLDFAKYFEHIFKDIEDFETEKIMNIVYEDEISHVAYGRNWLNKWREEKSLWEYYNQLLPEKITPARAKAMMFDYDSRVRAGLDKEFIDNVKNYSDDFVVTNRREWKK